MENNGPGAQRFATLITALAFALLMVYIVVPVIGLADEEVVVASILFLLLSSLLVCFVTLHRLRKKGRGDVVDYFNVASQRRILGLFMIFYGVPKLLGNFFDYQLFALDSRLADVSEFELAWYYFGKNPWQELFAGVMEVVPGCLLLLRRQWFIGALLLLPVTGQVFLLNLFFHIGGITFPAAVILLGCNISLIYSQRKRLSALFAALDLPQPKVGRRTHRLFTVVRWLVPVTVLAVVLVQSRQSWGASEASPQYRGLVGVYRLEKAYRDGQPQPFAGDSLIYRDLYIEKQARWNVLRRGDGKTQAFLLQVTVPDSLVLCLNRGEMGDGPDRPDSASVLKARYRITRTNLIIKGQCRGHEVEWIYRKSLPAAKRWFW